MSSSTQVSVTPRVVHHVRVSEEDSIAVENVLGRGGMPLLREALENIQQTRAKLGMASTEHLAWSRVQRDQYELAIEGATVELQLEGSLAHIRVVQTQTVQAGVRATVSEERIREAHKRVNELFATVTAQRLQEKVSQRAKIDLRVGENHTIQAFARLRVA